MTRASAESSGFSTRVRLGTCLSEPDAGQTNVIAGDHRERIDSSPGTRSIFPYGDCDLPARRHAQVSRPHFEKGRRMSSYTAISSEKLSRLIGTHHAPALIDVRPDDDFAADPRLIPGASRRSHRVVQDWAASLAGQSVVVICQKGSKLSEGTAAWLRHGGIAAEILEGGHLGWSQAGLPT